MQSFDEFGKPQSQGANASGMTQRPSMTGNRAANRRQGGGFGAGANPNPANSAQVQNSRVTLPPQGGQQQQQQLPPQGRLDPNAIRGQVDTWMKNNNTQGHQDADYWVQRITESGGLGADNMGYWQGRFEEPRGLPGPGGAGGGMSGSFSQSSYQSQPKVNYTPGQLPSTDLSVYKPGQINQYKNVDTGPTQGMANSVLQQVLKAPSLSPEVIAQMEGQFKDQALTMQQGQQGDIRQNFASRGLGGGGQERSLLASLGQNTQANLLNNYRDLNVGAAQTNRQDMLNALGAAEQGMGGEVNRAQSQYQTGLQGQMAQEGLNQAGVQSQNQATQFALQRALEQEGMAQAAAGIGVQGRGQDIQSLLGLRGQDIQHQLGLGGLGFNYAQLNANQQNTQQQALLRALGLA